MRKENKRTIIQQNVAESRGVSVNKRITEI